MTSLSADEVELKPVDSMDFIVLVDNIIEWMSKLPAGFSSEVRLHLSAEPPVDPVTQTPILDLDNYCCGAHGLSILIITRDGDKVYHTLFDTGPDGRALARNLDSLEINISVIDRIVLSHWHRDHSGGLVEFLKRRQNVVSNAADGNVVVDVHPSRPIARGIAPPPTFDQVIARLPKDPEFSEIENIGGVVLKESEAHTVQGGTVFVSGEIPRITAWEKGLPGGVRWMNKGNTEDGGATSGEWVAEPEIKDERYVAVDVKGKGLVLFSACSHAGIGNVVKDALKRFQRPIYAVVGGLHLAGPELGPRIAPTVELLQSIEPEITYVIPLHCTGQAARTALVNAFGDRCVPAGVGIKACI
ncbi:hypothetical protein FRB91_007473 [Serendipita sp. 411]|nr:hypothetical protein FRB91_007473 [Serendipita sp. 411]